MIGLVLEEFRKNSYENRLFLGEGRYNLGLNKHFQELYEKLLSYNSSMLYDLLTRVSTIAQDF